MTDEPQSTITPNRDFLLREWYAVRYLVQHEKQQQPIIWSAVHYLEALERKLAQMIVKLEELHE